MRVLLVEDDPSTKRFVALALEDLPLQLDCCDSIAGAMALLADTRYALILTDLMLKGESALDLVQRLVREPVLLGNARIVVYSAGLTRELQAKLMHWGVWRTLHKPVPLAVLRDCVQQAFAPRTDNPPPHATADASPTQATVVDTHFAGNRALFLAFRESCLRQLPQDIAAARRALSTRDAASLHRLAHSLKSVLLTLGEAHASQLARDAEIAGREENWDGLHWHWPALLEFLESYTGAAPGDSTHQA